MTALSLTIVACVLLLGWLWRKLRFSVIRHVPGPDRGSFLLGNMPELLQRQAGETDFEWQRSHGDVIRFTAPFGEDRLMIADPKALQYILQTSGYRWHKYNERRELTRIMVGKGLSWADGEDHVRQKKVMLPGFAGPEIKALLPLFFNCATLLTSKWQEEIGTLAEQTTVLNVVSHISRATLDALGHAAFDYDFGATTNRENPLARALGMLFTSTFGQTTNGQIVFLSIARFLPLRVLRAVNDRSPNPKLVHTRKTGEMTNEIARDLIKSKSAALLKGNIDRRDIMSLLVKANHSEEPKARLTEEELLAQMRTLIVAGQETSSNTLGWTLLELSRHPLTQGNLRREIRARRKVIHDRGDTEFTVQDLDAMPYLSSVLKESLRLHPVAMHILRQSAREDVLPLSGPIELTTGEKVTQLSVPKGLRIVASVAAYNRNQNIFGEDAHEFNPERWLGPSRVKTDAPLGVYANLATFSGGVRSCIGWRFAVLEMQAFLMELIDNFEFSLAPESHKIRRESCLIMQPTIEGELEKGCQLPLQVRIASRDE
ncbi:cytochrome p450 [Moniliophthora roreri]|uniref:Cytochrome p450 n=1 Tax=Moniliophthora roreri TaxID=221103 RepID=A0A0W0F1D2_MONRR|nr:cytochrome p450 [Moniliophthora roreri]